MVDALDVTGYEENGAPTYFVGRYLPCFLICSDQTLRLVFHVGALSEDDDE